MSALPEGVTIREGGYYQRRDGEVVRALSIEPEDPTWPWLVGKNGDGAYWYDYSGCYNSSSGESELDLVAEAPVPGHVREAVIDGVVVKSNSTLRTDATLPTDSQARKDTPVYSGVVAYFPLALAEIARLSKAGNDKHNPGEPLHWSRGKSNDHADCIMRHLMEIGTRDPDDGHLHATKLAWRALAVLQIELENLKKSGVVSS